ncbi:hypothetical protein E2C01_098196 [Portunus trituberculatus]|uniref:Uncharacterized protein n=1 Tax=Portunus trituberculatus TaxID=210409 RepID=A0A5B7K2E1_PORTR|nr:hypothetical protein [Portunus trituberculatus]
MLDPARCMSQQQQQKEEEEEEEEEVQRGGRDKEELGKAGKALKQQITKSILPYKEGTCLTKTTPFNNTLLHKSESRKEK